MTESETPVRPKVGGDESLPMQRAPLRTVLRSALKSAAMAVGALGGVFGLQMVLDGKNPLDALRAANPLSVLAATASVALLMVPVHVWAHRKSERWEDADDEARAHLINEQINRWHRPGWYWRAVAFSAMVSLVPIVPVALGLWLLVEPPRSGWGIIVGPLVAILMLEITLVPLFLRRSVLRKLTKE